MLEGYLDFKLLNFGVICTTDAKFYITLQVDTSLYLK